jgi:hypothetical protein
MKLILLLEDLGNLKFINGKFYNFLKTRPFGKDKKEVLPINYGENSEVKSQPNITKVKLGGLVEDEDFIIGILSHKDKQLAMIKKYKHNSDSKYEIVLDLDLIESGLDYEKLDKFEDMELESNLEFFKLNDNHLESKMISDNRIDKQLRILLDVLKLYSSNMIEDRIDFKYALVDKTRAELSSIRRKRTSLYGDDGIKIFPSRVPGSNELTSENDFHLQSIKSLLKARLENYKIKNATNIDSIDKLLDIVKSEGIKDVFKVKGFTYKMQTMSNFDVRTLKGEGNDKAYVIYELNQSDEKLKTIQQTYKHFEELFGDIGKWPEGIRKHWNAIKPPVYIKVEMKFRFGQIIPVNVMGSDRSY